VLRLLATELADAMVLSGRPRLADVDASLVRRAPLQSLRRLSARVAAVIHAHRSGPLTSTSKVWRLAHHLQSA
jgi:hypothetical protein